MPLFSEIDESVGAILVIGIVMRGVPVAASSSMTMVSTVGVSMAATMAAVASAMVPLSLGRVRGNRHLLGLHGCNGNLHLNWVAVTLALNGSLNVGDLVLLLDFWLGQCCLHFDGLLDLYDSLDDLLNSDFHGGVNDVDPVWAGPDLLLLGEGLVRAHDDVSVVESAIGNSVSLDSASGTVLDLLSLGGDNGDDLDFGLFSKRLMRVGNHRFPHGAFNGLSFGDGHNFRLRFNHLLLDFDLPFDEDGLVHNVFFI